MGRVYQQAFHRRANQNTKKHKIRLISLVFREMQIKSTERYYFTYITLAKIQKPYKIFKMVQ